MRVLITGSSGFIGTFLSRALLERKAIAGKDGRPSRSDELILTEPEENRA